MNRFFLVITLFVSSIVFGQNSETTKNVSSIIAQENSENKFDSISKSVGLKRGEKYKIYVQFKVTEIGNIEILKIKAPHSIFDNEVKRIFEKMPKMKPAIVDGNPTSTTYMLPISFYVETEAEERKRIKKENKKKKKNKQ